MASCLSVWHWADGGHGEIKQLSYWVSDHGAIKQPYRYTSCSSRTCVMIATAINWPGDVVATDVSENL